MSHTPRPWTVSRSGSKHVAVYASHKRRIDPICIFGIGHDDSSVKFKNMHANARLIAAAPDMLVALKLALDEIHHPGAARVNNRDIDEVIRAAIAKAEGKP